MPTPPPPPPPPPPPLTRGTARESRLRKTNRDLSTAELPWDIRYPFHQAALTDTVEGFIGKLQAEFEFADGSMLRLAEMLILHDDEGWSPLHYAAWNGNIASVLKILSAATMVESQLPQRTKSCYNHTSMSCVRTSHVPTRNLVVNAASIDRHSTPLHLAAGMGYLEVVKALIVEGDANMEALDCDNWKPYDVAKRTREDTSFANKYGMVCEETWQHILMFCSRFDVLQSFLCIATNCT
eukprot:CFRG1830T1